MAKYIALFEQDEGADLIGVVFPDLPGCFSAGKDYEDAVRNAHEALSAHIEALKEDGDEIPAPRTLKQIQKEWEEWDEWKNSYDFTIAYINYYPRPISKKYTVFMDTNLMAQIDEVTKNRSAFLTEAAKAALANERFVSAE